ncbi:cbb3-type cytochrome c oxidase subunit II [Verrucomicrobiaceae bacterium R5-34]|nr:cbb3-type cytochrome c oxidase subunit II [Verrucomicrobiaceae bacterium R5-34]
MTFKSFLIGMCLSFGMAWMFVIAIPTAKMNNLSPVKMNNEEDAPYYQHKRSGRVLNGAEIYASNGCYACHTQLIRPTYAGRQIWRDDMAGVVDSDGNDSRRETTYFDYAGEKYAQIGLMRMGPDLSNVAYRVEKYAAATNLSAEQWLMEHLYNPRNNKLRVGEGGELMNMDWSNCQAQHQMFKKSPVVGQGNVLALREKTEDGEEIVPKEDALVLASYLMSLRRDDVVPASMNNAPVESAEDAE